MKRLPKFRDPRMVSARVEAIAYDDYWDVMRRQSYLTLQDFLNYCFQLFNERKIGPVGKDFKLFPDGDAPILPDPDRNPYL